MKIISRIVVFVLWLLQAVSCKEDSKPDPSSLHQPDAILPSTEVTHKEADQAIKDQAIKKLRRHLDRENFYFNRLTIEQLIGLPDDVPRSDSPKPILTDAFILSVDADGSIHVVERIRGQVPTDYEKFLPFKPTSGKYLAGRLMPQGGWTLGGTRDKASFCCVILSDDTFAYGFEGELTGRLESIRAFGNDNR